MGIEKMSLINIVGQKKSLGKALLKCFQSQEFHIEYANSSQGNFGTNIDENQYSLPLQQCVYLLEALGIEKKYQDFNEIANMTDSENKEMFEKIDEVLLEANNLKKKIQSFKDEIRVKQDAVENLEKMIESKSKITNVFSSENSVVKFGRMPHDSYLKIDYFDKAKFLFVPLDEKPDFCWGVYFAPLNYAEEVEKIFTSLYFEPIKISDNIKKTPRATMYELSNNIKDETQKLEQLQGELDKMIAEKGDFAKQSYSYLTMKNEIHSYKKYSVVTKDKFHLEGFVAKNKVKSFIKLFEEDVDIICEENHALSDDKLTPPTKLKTNWFFKPFEMFVEMYGLPAYNGINPTSFIGCIYVILFGIMFGDVGQGLLIVLLGIFLWKKKKMLLGAILSRCGFSSMLFGMVYGSVFGFEHMLDPFYKMLGFAEKPVHVFDSNTTNILLVSAIGLGVLIIVMSISINIYLGLKQKDYNRAIFSNNGLAGLILYLGAVIGAVLMLMFDINVLNPIFIIVIVVIPLLMMFLREPLTKLVNKRKDLKPHEGIGGFIVENIFELFEFLLSFVTNTMSFLRIGGFILSHAGMMAVVMTLSEMVGGVGSPFVIIFGNAFVMGLEGLLVGIQVLRLVFYETFSRFYDGTGKAFEPIKITYEDKSQD